MAQTERIGAGERAETSSVVRCPICGAPMRDSGLRGRDRLITGDGPFTVVECPDCQYGLTLPQLSADELALYYPPEYFDFWGYSGRPGENVLQRLLARFRSWSATRSYDRRPYVLDAVPPGRMLDVGCGSGDLLEHFAKQGWEPYGIDPSASAVAAAAERGVTVHQGTLRDQPWRPGSFALITFQHSLEHVEEPLDALREAAALLGPADHRRAELGLLAAAPAVPQPLASPGTAQAPAALLAARARTNGAPAGHVGANGGDDLEPPGGRVQPALRVVRAPSAGMATVALLRAWRPSLPARVPRRPRGGW
jgi:SAM-dependent methyltransferase/ribosomal protein S27E